ncbi:hypothetical protein ACFO4E_25955 [Nocardiopsis mangrovi]|uniref:Tetratricopeptide repeat protein n=1 Tax=Nocardiopsis mangrovi TaxID=1179818 RepID=A0ABV9E436_9ACTN
MTIGQLDGEIRSELGTLPRTLAEVVGRHMVMAGRLLDEDPERAYEHAIYARRKASRIGVVREAAGIAAYTVGKWQEALSDLRAARRMTGRNNFLPVIADAERGLGRPERALEITRDPAAKDLDIEDRIELRIVAAGARHDLGEHQAALVELQVPELKERRARPWVARLFYAYADALLTLNRNEDAREYFARASAVDREGVTDADERLAMLEGVEIVDIDEDIMWTDAEESGNEAEPPASAGAAVSEVRADATDAEEASTASAPVAEGAPAEEGDTAADSEAVDTGAVRQEPADDDAPDASMASGGSDAPAGETEGDEERSKRS